VRVNNRPHAPAAETAPALRLNRLGLVVHPRREIDTAIDNARAWADANGAEIVQIPVSGQERVVADAGEVAACDLVLAVGGDGTALHALHAAAAVNRPVLGVACGSLGALTTVTADDLEDALDHVSRGEYEQRPLPALVAETGGERLSALNDLVLMRDGAGQVIYEIQVGGERFIRLAGDGLVVATPLGSSAYTLAADGPLLAGGAMGLVATPLSPHGGVCPPLVTGPDSELTVIFESGNGGARVELDGQVHETLGARQTTTFTIRLDPEFATLVSLGEDETAIAGLRRRRILMDSPRVLARDDREAQSGGRSQPPSDDSSSVASASSERSEPRAPIS
jgi:NAD+ kinase